MEEIVAYNVFVHEVTVSWTCRSDGRSKYCSQILEVRPFRNQLFGWKRQIRKLY